MTALQFKKGDRFALSTIVGDRDGNGKVDVTLVVHADLPFDGRTEMRKLTELGPFNMPATELPKFVSEAHDTFGPFIDKLISFARKFF